MTPKLKHLRYTGDFRISFTFTDGLVSELDFSDMVNSGGGLLDDLAKEDFFAAPLIDHGCLAWPNGYDICPDVLRFWAETGRVTSQEETDAHFASVLKSEAPHEATA